ncbi:MAG: hypothetical protein ABIV50_01745, partial [Opitutus sp.]
DALGWHEGARQHFRYWASRQNTDPIPAQLPPADEDSNLARSELALHSNGDLSNSHYDMNLVYLDALFRHLRWTGDVELARELWPVIERHLAWERRLFRREFGPENLPLYEAYAAIWASDDLEYHGGGTTHASAYNYFHHREAAGLARILGRDAQPYRDEADAIARGMRQHLWLPERGAFGEFKDLLGLQRVHPSAALWTFYHTMDSGLPTATEAFHMTQALDRDLPWLPVQGPGVPPEQQWSVPATTNWMPYSWSINNVVMGECVHTALGYWQAGRPDDAFRLMKSALLASMFMGICPGNVGSMNYLDVYRRESQRDFADGAGVTARALIEGLFGVKPDLLAGRLRFTPGFPAPWDRARLLHPDITVNYVRHENVETFRLEPHFGTALSFEMELPRRFAEVERVTVNQAEVTWQSLDEAIEARRIAITAPAANQYEIVVTWRGSFLTSRSEVDQNKAGAEFVTPQAPTGALEPIDLGSHFNDRVTQIFRNDYRSPRSPYVSLAIPKQGIGAWAGGVKKTATIDDSGLRARAAAEGALRLSNGVTFVTTSHVDEPNVLFTSRWDNYPKERTVALRGHAQQVWLLMAGSTNWMQSRIDNGEVIVTYTDGSVARLALENPTNWWPIEQDYLSDDFAFRRGPAAPLRVQLKTGRDYVPGDIGGPIDGGSATVLSLPLEPTKELRSLTLRTLSNEVVIGLMAVTLERP